MEEIERLKEDEQEEEQKREDEERDEVSVKRVHVFISGRVQGTFFRAFINRKAEELNLKGWVKNTKDERVEAVFEGEEDNIKEMLELCYEGPSGAKVENVEYNDEDLENLKDFEIKY